MKITVDPQLRTPLYRQIADEVKRLVGSGALRPGERIASVRELSAALGVNPATAAKAYRELADEGVLRTTSKSGTFVGGETGRLSPEASSTRIAQALDRFFAEIAACRLDEEQIADAFERRLGELVSARAGEPLRQVEHEVTRTPRVRAADDWAVW
jgi:GntR family transcriptional regulator